MTQGALGRHDIADALLELLDFREAPFALSRPDQPVVEANVEDATGSRNQRHFAELGLECREQLLRDPRGAQQPAALRAVSISRRGACGMALGGFARSHSSGRGLTPCTPSHSKLEL